MMAETSKEERLYGAVTRGDLGEVRELLGDPSVNVNWTNAGRWSLFMSACSYGRTSAVRYLMNEPPRRVEIGARPQLDVRDEIISLLADDPRVDVNKNNRRNWTPLFQAAANGRLTVVRLILASNKEVDTRSRATEYPGYMGSNKTAAEIARCWAALTHGGQNETEEIIEERRSTWTAIADLIDAYERNPAAVRQRLRNQLAAPKSGGLFALVVLRSDGYLAANDEGPARRFFDIASRLPLDLQMVLCNRVYGSTSDVVLSRDSGPWFGGL